jgi:hypothetical protein
MVPQYWYYGAVLTSVSVHTVRAVPPPNNFILSARIRYDLRVFELMIHNSVKLGKNHQRCVREEGNAGMAIQHSWRIGWYYYGK